MFRFYFWYKPQPPLNTHHKVHKPNDNKRAKTSKILHWNIYHWNMEIEMDIKHWSNVKERNKIKWEVSIKHSNQNACTFSLLIQCVCLMKHWSSRIASAKLNRKRFEAFIVYWLVFIEFRNIEIEMIELQTVLKILYWKWWKIGKYRLIHQHSEWDEGMKIRIKW